MNHALLASLIADQENPLAWLSESVPVPRGAILRREIKIVLLALGKLEAVEAAAPNFYHDPDFSTINLADPITVAVFARLLADGVITGPELEAINALGTAPAPRWQVLGLDAEPTDWDITACQGWATTFVRMGKETIGLMTVFFEGREILSGSVNTNEAATVADLMARAAALLNS